MENNQYNQQFISPEMDENLEATTEYGSTQPIVSEEPDEEVECGPLRGWLLLFLVLGVGLGSLISVGSALMEFESGSLSNLFAMDILTSLAYMAVGVFTIIAFVKRDPDAVFLGKMFIIITFTTAIAYFVVISMVNEHDASWIRSIIWSIIWFSFLCTSSQVAERIPVETRRILKRDWVLLAVVVLVNIIAYSTIFQFLNM